jgi:pyruvate/2-oxoglutarate dehydrogenase complex dihydrolipoamide acyltransferase (E2) component
MTEKDYTVKEWPRMRDLVKLFLDAHKPTTVYGHGECDVTTVMEKIKAIRRESRITLSLNTYLVYVVSRVAARHEALRSYKHGRKLIVFQHADVSLALLKKLPNGIRIPVIYIVREADTKSLARINQEIKDAIDSDLTADPNVKFRRALVKMPAFIQKTLYYYVFSHPERMKKVFGNVGITNLQQLGYDSPMTGLPPNIHTAAFSVGNVSERFRPNAKKQPELRKILTMGAGFDHLVMDGMSMASIAKDFYRTITQAEGIDETFVRESQEKTSGHS